MLTLNSYPNACLNGADDCLKLDFGTTNLVESTGSLTKAIISETDASDFQIGTTISINGVKFTLAASTDFDTNEITYSATESTMLVNLAASFSANYHMLKNYSIFINGTDLELTPKKATLQTEIAYTNLSGVVESKEVSFDPDPVTVRPGYSVKVCLIDDDTTEELAEVRIFALPTANDDLTDIDSYLIEKDISKIIKSYLSSPIPFNTLSKVFTISGPIRRITFEFAEVYGSPLNQFKRNVLNGSFAVINGGSRMGWDGVTAYCNSFINPEESGVKVTCDQSNWLYKYVSNPTDVTIRATVDFKDVNGSSLGTATIGTNTNEEYLYGIQTGLIQLSAQLSSAGASITEVKSYTVTVEYQESAVVQDTDVFTYEVINEPDNECLVFLNSLGTFSSISTQGLDSRTLEIAQEFIELCTPCNRQPYDQASKTVNIKQTLALSFNLFNVDTYQHRMLEELFSSKEVYWRSGGNYYHIQPQNDNTQLYQRKANINPVFNARLYY